jgi:uncharacterized protein
MTSRRLLVGPVAIALASVLMIAAAVPTLAEDDDYPTLKYWVTDNANVLLQLEELEIEALCIEAYKKKGVEIAVLTVNTTAPDEISMYAVKTFEKNKLGQEGKDDGLLVMVATDDRSWRIEVGYGLEGVLPDIKVSQIAEDYMIPDLETGDYYNALLYTVAFLGEEILDNYHEGKPPKDDGDPYPISWLPLTWGQLILVMVIFVVISLFTGGRGLWLGSLFYGSRGRKWGGGRSGGGGARGKW